MGDGVFYREVAQNFLDDIENASYNLVQLTRILPFALLNLSFSAFHIVKDLEAMRNGMIIWQLVFLALSLYWYFRICKKIRAKTPLITLGFILLFFNFTWLKDFWYHPFSPDGLAFALGMGQTNYFLRYEKFKLGLMSLLGAFVSPLLVASGLLMLFLPGDKLKFYPGERPKSSFPLLLGLAIPFVLAVVGWGIWNWADDGGYAQANHALSLFILVPMSVWIARRNPIDWEASLVMLKKRMKSEKLSKGLMALAGLLFILLLLSGNNESLSPIQLIRDIGNGALRFPLDFILGLGLQWGLGIVLTGLYLRRFAEELGNLGWAAVIIIGLSLILLPFLGSLALGAWVPLWIAILLKGMKRYHLGNKDLIILGVSSLFISLTWLQINSQPLVDWLTQPLTENAESFPIQKLAMHLDQYRNWVSYGIGVLTLVSLGAILQLRRKRYQRVMTQ